MDKKIMVLNYGNSDIEIKGYDCTNYTAINSDYMLITSNSDNTEIHFSYFEDYEDMKYIYDSLISQF